MKVVLKRLSQSRDKHNRFMSAYAGADDSVIAPDTFLWVSTNKPMPLILVLTEPEKEEPATIAAEADAG